MKVLRSLLLFAFASITVWGSAAEMDPCFPPKPANEDQLVFQYTNFLDNQQEADLNTKLVNFALETSNRIPIVAWDPLSDMPTNCFGS